MKPRKVGIVFAPRVGLADIIFLFFRAAKCGKDERLGDFFKRRVICEREEEVKNKKEIIINIFWFILSMVFWI